KKRRAGQPPRALHHPRPPVHDRAGQFGAPPGPQGGASGVDRGSAPGPAEPAARLSLCAALLRRLRPLLEGTAAELRGRRRPLRVVLAGGLLTPPPPAESREP